MSGAPASTMRWLVAAGMLFLANVFLHLPVEDVFDGFAKQFGFIVYEQQTQRAFAALGVLCLVAAWAWPSSRRLAVGATVTTLLVLGALAQVLLVVVSIENIHYPQYAMLTCVLAAGLPSLEGAWLTATGLSTLDELYQRVMQTRGTPEYFDWNDVILNAIGAAFGIAIVLAISRRRDARTLIPARGMLSFAVGIVALTWLVDAPSLTLFNSVTPGGRAFHRVAASEAAIVLIALWAGMRLIASAQSSPNLPAR